MMRYIPYMLFLTFAFYGCEDVVDIETPSEEPRLVIDGIIKVDEDDNFIPVEIQFSLTNNFFKSVGTTSVEKAIIVIEELDENGNTIETTFSDLAETQPGSGRYIPDPNAASDQRIPIRKAKKNVRFSLLVTYNGRSYFATTRYVKASPIDRLIQGDGTLFDEEETEVALTFTDIPGEDNFYVFDFGFNEFLVTEDTFYKDQQFEFSYFYDKDLRPGTKVEIQILGADENFYNYMDLLITQSGTNQGPFQTPVATVRGNIFDATDIDINNIDSFDNVNRPDSYALGYFAVVQKYSSSITIE